MKEVKGALEGKDQAMAFLENLKKTVQTKKQELEKQLQILTEELDTAYIQKKESPYYLHSVVVHDGLNAESGHYYSFVYDRAT